MLPLITLCLPCLKILADRQPGRAFVPIVGNELLIGGSRKGKWLDSDQSHRLVKRGERFRFFTLDGKIGEVVCEKLEKVTEGGQGYNLTYNTELPHHADTNSRDDSGTIDEAIGVAGTWNPMPRPLRTETPEQQVYLDSVEAVLKSKGLPRAKPHIRKIVRVDLNGKGVDSVLIDAASPDDYGSGNMTAAHANSYCFILLRTVVGGKLKSCVLNGDFWKKPPGMMAEEDCHLLAVLDLTGDGSMEVVTFENAHEGFDFTIYQLTNGMPKSVLTGGDGL